MLENTRFHPGETKNDPEFARELADGCDLYVNDAFGSAHRAHASTEAVAHLLPAYAGLLLERELEELGSLLEDPARPFVAISAGAKVEDKIGVLESLAEKADTVLVGGKMAEEVEPRDKVRAPGGRRRGFRLRGGRRREGRRRRTRFPTAGSGSTSGPKTREAFAAKDRGGGDRVLERADGRLRVAAVRGGDGGGRAGGGGLPTGTRSSGAATPSERVQELGLADRIDWVSTGGGASLEFLEGKELPGVVAIPEA